MPFYQEVEKLTIDLVRTPSMNNTTGEAVLAEKIASYLRSIEYFQKHPQYVWEVPLKDDRYGRKNVIAFLKGEKGSSSKTIILHGHIDTVGIEDFGKLKDYAFDPIVLAEKLKEVDLPPEVREDLESGEWMFGRGTNDMKSGLAAHMVVLKEMTKRVEELDGNIIFMANPIEENQHTGIIEALPFLKELQEEKGLEYTVAINNDYTSPLYLGDKNRYIYLGAVGKLLPCFYIVGKETHVGQCYEGLDPNLIAAELLRLVNLNADLCDEYKGEFTLPPAALKLTDLKPAYNVQTPVASFLYFNYFTHDLSVEKVIDILKEKSEQAFENVINYLNGQYRNYCSKTGLAYTTLPWKSKVITFRELYEEVKKDIGLELDEIINKIAKDMLNQGVDTRIICQKIVEEVKELSKEVNPLIILYFAPPYCPHNTLKGETAAEKELMDTLESLAQEFAATTGNEFAIKQFFPALTDSSYLKIDDDEKSINALMENFPEWDTIYPVPVREIRKANIPAINFGTYGKDAHKWTERVYKPYTFSVLPRLTIRAIEKILAM